MQNMPNRNKATRKPTITSGEKTPMQSVENIETGDANQKNTQEEPLSLDAIRFQNKELSKLFELVDKLRDCGVSEEISVPQLVVVGDQSSGKSSVLEALTQVPFPVASTLCTRFATNISFRRSPSESIHVTILPAKDSEEDRNQRLREFSKTPKVLTTEVFLQILAEASNEMGLPQPGQEYTGGGSRFADDVLKIEICGPEKSLFSVVDVPGLFQSATTYQTDEDAEVVESLVKRYIGESRTIILAVASSLHETANQKVFRLAKEADPQGNRTVGVLTKPDAVQQGDEQRVLDVALNRITPLTHGWYVVRNRSTEEVKNGMSLEKRKIAEKRFFQNAPWSTLDKERVGIKSLEKFLQGLLCDHLRKEFPAMCADMDALVLECRRELSELGASRESTDEQRQHLLKLANDFQGVAKNSILGIYELDNGYFRVRTDIRQLNDDFANELREHGHLHDFNDETISGNIINWVQTTYVMFRGIELPGMANPQVLRSLFRMQTEKWDGIASKYLSRVRTVVNDFNRRLLQEKCPDPELRMRLWTRLQGTFSSAYEKAQDELRRILRDEKGDFMIALDDSFTSRLEEIRKGRMLEALTSNSSFALVEGDSEHRELSFPALVERTYRSREDQAIWEIFDVLKSYYMVARTRFLDAVVLYVVERHFMGEDGPIRAFSPEFVGRLSTDELESIAGEEFAVVNKRRNLRAKLAHLEKGQEVVSAYI